LRRPSRERTLCGALVFEMRVARVARASCGEDIPDDLAVDGAGDAVLELEVHLGDRVLSEDGGVRDVTCVGILSVRRFSIDSFTPIPSFSVSGACVLGFSGSTYG
jgi:hypothetical protein